MSSFNNYLYVFGVSELNKSIFESEIFYKRLKFKMATIKLVVYSEK